MTACAILLAVFAAVACIADPGPLLIEFGQTTPDTRLMRQHVEYWEEYLPFDGVVIPINPAQYAGRYGHFRGQALPWTAIRGVPADLSDYQHAIDDLKATAFRKFRHNFIYVNFHYGEPFPWFDDELWGGVLHNVRILATIAKEGGCEGIWLDPEQYSTTRIWNFGALVEAFPNRPQDFTSYQNLVRRRGAQFIEAINEVYPGCEVVTVWGSSFTYNYHHNKDNYERLHFSQLHYGLLPAFVDGLLFAADEQTTITDGYERSYTCKTEEEFAEAHVVVREACKEYSQIPEFYSKNIHVGLALFPTHPNLFNPRDFTENHFSPDDLAEAVRLAMRLTDRYLWIWNEATSFWIKGGVDGVPLLAHHASQLTTPPEEPTVENVMREDAHGLPQAYMDAIARGKALALQEGRNPRVSAAGNGG